MPWVENLVRHKNNDQTLTIMLTRNRKVFGRVKTSLGDANYKIELRKSGIWIRKKHQRKIFHLTFADAISAAEGQLGFL